MYGENWKERRRNNGVVGDDDLFGKGGTIGFNYAGGYWVTLKTTSLMANPNTLDPDAAYSESTELTVFVPVIPDPQQGIPGVSIVEFGPDYSDPDNLGINVKFGYTDPNNQFSEYGWIQTVRTNKPQNFPKRPPMGKYEPFNDTPGDDTPYYPMTFSNTEGFSSIMVDHPGRDRNSAYVIWRAEVTIGGIRDGVFVPIGTMTYGFDIFDGKLDVIYPHLTQPTPWHVDSINNKSKW